MVLFNSCGYSIRQHDAVVFSNAVVCCCVFVVHTLSSWTSNLVDPASSHTLVSKIKPCMSYMGQLLSWQFTILVKKDLDF